MGTVDLDNGSISMWYILGPCGAQGVTGRGTAISCQGLRMDVWFGFVQPHLGLCK